MFRLTRGDELGGPLRHVGGLPGRPLGERSDEGEPPCAIVVLPVLHPLAGPSGPLHPPDDHHGNDADDAHSCVWSWSLSSSGRSCHTPGGPAQDNPSVPRSVEPGGETSRLEVRMF